jgi:hypothetical protein
MRVQLTAVEKSTSRSGGFPRFGVFKTGWRACKLLSAFSKRKATPTLREPASSTSLRSRAGGRTASIRLQLCGSCRRERNFRPAFSGFNRRVGSSSSISKKLPLRWTQRCGRPQRNQEIIKGIRAICGLGEAPEMADSREE